MTTESVGYLRKNWPFTFYELLSKELESSGCTKTLQSKVRLELSLTQKYK